MKSRKMKNILYLLLGLMLSHGAGAQSLEELLNELEKQSLVLEAYNWEWQADQQRAGQVQQLEDPEIGLGLFALPVETRVGAQLARLSFRQALPRRQLNQATQTLYQEQAGMAPLRRATSLLQLQHELKMAYFELFLLKEKREIISKNLQLFQALKRLTLIKVENGLASTSDVLQVDLKISEWERELDQLRLKRFAPQSKINSLLNRSLETTVLLLDTFPLVRLENVTFDPEEVDQHPTLLQQDLAQKLLGLDQQLAQAERKPSYSVGVDYLFLTERNDIELNKNGRDVLQLKGSIKIPLNAKVTEAKIEELSLRQKAIQTRRQEKRQAFELMEHHAFVGLERVNVDYDHYVRQKQILEVTIRILQDEYSTQETDFSYLLQMENDLIKLELKILDTLVESQRLKADLESLIVN